MTKRDIPGGIVAACTVAHLRTIIATQSALVDKMEATIETWEPHKKDHLSEICNELCDTAKLFEYYRFSTPKRENSND